MIAEGMKNPFKKIKPNYEEDDGFNSNMQSVHQ